MVFMLQFYHFALLTLLELPIAFGQIGLYGGTKTARRCFGQAGLPQIEFKECLPDEMILVLDAVQGFNQGAGGCQYRNSDCMEPTATTTDNKLRAECIGKSTCAITMSMAWMPKCSAYSTYNQVLYQCIPEENVIDICEEIDTSSNSKDAFIKSPGYPFSYPAGLDCTCRLSTDPGQRILLKFADYSLEWSEECENDILQVKEGSSRMPRCGQLPRNYNITSQTHELELRFMTNQWQQFKGFWLVIEALGNVNIRCGPTRTIPPDEGFGQTEQSTTQSTTLKTTTLTTRQPPAPALPPDYNYEKGFGQDDYRLAPNPDIYDPFFNEDDATQQQQTAGKGKGDQSSTSRQGGVIAGVIIGCLLALVLIVVLIFLLVWFKRRRHKEEITSGQEHTYRAKVGKRPTTPPTPPQRDTHV